MKLQKLDDPLVVVFEMCDSLGKHTGRAPVTDRHRSIVAVLMKGKVRQLMSEGQ